MKNIASWKPSKFLISENKLIPSGNIGRSSKRMAQYIAAFYNAFIPKYCSGKLLDLGCGNVPMYDFYKNFVSEVVCVDWQFSEHSQFHLDLACDLNSRIPLGDQLFETIILSDVIEHLTDIRSLFKEIERLLVPGGKLLINYPFMYSLHETPYDYCRYTHFYIEQICLNNGLQILEKIQFGNSFDVIENLLLKNVKKIKGGRYAERMLYRFFSFFNRVKLSSISNNSFTASPFGYGFVITKPRSIH